MKHTKGNMNGEAVLRKERQTEMKGQYNTCDRKTKGTTQQEEKKQSEAQKEEKALGKRDKCGKCMKMP